MSPQVSMARQKYTDECEAAINEQIKSVQFLLFLLLLLLLDLCICVLFLWIWWLIDFFFGCFFVGSVEYNVSYVYHSLFAYFDRDNIALKGFAK